MHLPQVIRGENQQMLKTHHPGHVFFFSNLRTPKQMMGFSDVRHQKKKRVFRGKNQLSLLHPKHANVHIFEDGIFDAQKIFGERRKGSQSQGRLKPAGWGCFFFASTCFNDWSTYNGLINRWFPLIRPY